MNHGDIYMVQSPIYHSASDLSGYPWPSLGAGFPPGADAAGCVGRAGERGTLLSHLFRQLRVQGGANGNEAVGVDCETKYGSGNQKRAGSVQLINIFVYICGLLCLAINNVYCIQLYT